MARLVLLSALIDACLLVSSLALPSSRILDGNAAGTQDFPYIVSVRCDNIHVCGGSIITREHILTAAHCVSEIGAVAIEKSRVSIRAGSNNLYAGGRVHTVAEITIHPSYGSNLNDIAILRLSSILEYGPRVQAIGLSKATEDVLFGDNVTIAGWGSPTSGGAYATKLQYASTNALSSEKCDDLIRYNYPSVLCLQSKLGQPKTGACTGDDGGPAVVNDKLVGVSSLVIGTCGTKYPDVYTRVSSFYDWILTVINDGL